MKKTILVSGGAGYIGSVLVRILLSGGYKVRVMDNLSFGGEPLLDLINHPDFEFVKGDTTNAADIQMALEGDVFAVAHLAAIVGDPACAKTPELARKVNLDATKQFYDLCQKAGIARFVFASTCSNYGRMDDPNVFLNEESKLAPVSLYAETKVEAEKYLLSRPKTNKTKPIVLRFSTVYGLSLRPRFDLTVNEFTKELSLGRELVVFGEQFWRPYCHVIDLARSVMSVIEAKEEVVAFEVFNVGDSSENYQKQMIVEEITKQIPGCQVKYVKKSEDPRDYRVSFDKIKERLGFKTLFKVPDGIREIRKVIADGFILNPDDQKYRNV